MAGAGYDISASRSEATSQALNTTAETIINFGDNSKVWGGAQQSATPVATAVAARNAGNTEPDISPAGFGSSPTAQNKYLIAAVAVIAVGAAIAIYFVVKKG
jgi:hypothetical protein